jgi:hypothetical protein
MNAFRAAIIILVLSSIASASPSPDRFDPFLSKSWYGIYMDDKKIGYASISVDKLEPSQWQYSTDMSIEFTMNQTSVVVTTLDKRIYEGDDAALVSSDYINKSPAGAINVKGIKTDSKYEITVDVMGQRSSKVLDYPVETLDDIMEIQMRARAGNLQPGETFTQVVFVPEPMILDTMTHEIEYLNQRNIYISGIKTEVYAFRDSMPSLESGGNVYVEKSGNVLAQEYPSMDMVMKLEPEDMAKALDSGYDILKDNIIKASGGPSSPKDVDSAEYILSGIDIANLPHSPWITIKTLSSDSADIKITRGSLPEHVITMPFSNENMAPYLMPEPLIQSDNEEIKNLAAEIVGDEKNSFEAAKKINQWVYENIEKEFAPAISNAYQTLKTGKGDCGENATLAVALMRAAGIPSRIAAGVAYVPYASGFGYHAWVEVFVGEWLQMDPTWGEPIADATHIMLARGNLKNLIIAVLNSLRNLKIQIKSYQ